MIKDQSLAKELLTNLEQCVTLMNKSLLIAKEKCTKEEYEIFKKAIGIQLGEFDENIIMPIHKLHPELEL